MLGIAQLARKIGVFDRLAAAVEMALAAGGPAGVAHIFGDVFQIHVFRGHAGSRRCFFISVRGVVTDQTIDAGHVVEVKRSVFPTVSNVTGCATSLVADGADSEIVERRRGLAVLNLLSMLHGIGAVAFPQPVNGGEHVFTGGSVAAQAFARDYNVMSGFPPASGCRVRHRPTPGA